MAVNLRIKHTQINIDWIIYFYEIGEKGYVYLVTRGEATGSVYTNMDIFARPVTKIGSKSFIILFYTSMAYAN